MEPALIFELFLFFLVINFLVYKLWVYYDVLRELGYALVAIAIVIVEALFFIFLVLCLITANEETRMTKATVMESMVQSGNRLKIELLSDDGETYTYEMDGIPVGELLEKGDRVLVEITTTTYIGLIEEEDVIDVDMLEDAEQPDAQPAVNGE